MRSHRFWIDIMIIGTTAACALALLLATLFATLGAAVEVAQPG